MYALTRYHNPVSSLSTLMDDVFGDNLFEWSNRDLSTTSWPRVDITETENAYAIKADLPGMEKKDINVRVENGVLSIAGEKKQEHEKREKDRYYHLERSYGTFERSFTLPDHVDQAGIEASFKNGVLELTLKKTEEAKPKAIDVKING